MLGGQVSISFLTLSSALAHIRSGAPRALAVAGDQRAQQMPEVLSLAEAGFGGVRGDAWFSIVGPPACRATSKTASSVP
jgi:tripartite-type tricarboxylate transporter receptor subunit TctC